jgi:hypothetical protein
MEMFINGAKLSYLNNEMSFGVFKPLKMFMVMEKLIFATVVKELIDRYLVKLIKLSLFH